MRSTLPGCVGARECSKNSDSLGLRSCYHGSMKETISFGSSPCDEPCVQVGDDNYEELTREECQRFIDLIRKRVGPEPEGARLFIKSEAFERWQTWHRQSLLPREFVVTRDTRFVPLRAGFGGGVLGSVFQFVWPLEVTEREPGSIDDPYLIIERVNPSQYDRWNRYVFTWATWHFNFLLLDDEQARLVTGPWSKEQREWWRSMERIWEPWRWKSQGEDWK